MIITTQGLEFVSSLINWSEMLLEACNNQIYPDEAACSILEDIWRAAEIEKHLTGTPNDPWCDCLSSMQTNNIHLKKKHTHCNPYSGGDYNGHCGGCDECMSMQIAYYEMKEKGIIQ